MFDIFPIANHELSERAKSLGLVLRFSVHHVDIVFDSKIIRISREHSLYLSDIINNFSYYFDAVWPLRIDKEIGGGDDISCRLFIT